MKKIVLSGLFLAATSAFAQTQNRDIVQIIFNPSLINVNAMVAYSEFCKPGAIKWGRDLTAMEREQFAPEERAKILISHDMVTFKEELFEERLFLVISKFNIISKFENAPMCLVLRDTILRDRKLAAAIEQESKK